METKIDYKKENKDLYLPKTKPSQIQVPTMKFIMVKGKGDPNDLEGDYSRAIEILYGLSFTIKMSKMGSRKIEGYVDYVVPPLEGFWWMEGKEKGIDYRKKEDFSWYCCIRQPEFVTKEVFDWAVFELKKKKPEINIEGVSFTELEEGLCVQIMHHGPYDDEPATIELMDHYMEEKGLKNAIGTKNKEGWIRCHHEIYLSDPRKAKPENLKTVIRIPVEVK